MDCPKKMEIDRLHRAITDLVELIERLRGPGGCPWDAEQTDLSIRVYLLEEAYEVLEAIEKSSPPDVCLESGDLLFQILFLAQLAAERKEFDFIDVVEKVTKKMIHRHPHVFGNAKAKNAEDVAMNWAKIKREEKRVSGDTASILKNIPMNLPALSRAHRLSERASKVNFDWPDASRVLDKINEEFMELESAIAKKDNKAFAEEMGDLLFSLVNLSRHWGLNAENILRDANQKFTERFEKMEKTLKISGIELEEATPEMMNQAWEKIKDR